MIVLFLTILTPGTPGIHFWCYFCDSQSRSWSNLISKIIPAINLPKIWYSQIYTFLTYLGSRVFMVKVIRDSKLIQNVLIVMTSNQ